VGKDAKDAKDAMMTGISSPRSTAGAEGGRQMASLGRILVADDEELCLRTTADMLREGGYECSCALDAATAIDMLGEQDYDLLVADIDMPGNRELELVREVPRITDGVSVILLTGKPSVDSAVESFHLPVSAYLVKPVKMRELLDQVGASIARAGLRRAVLRAGKRAEDWRRELASLEEALEAAPRGSAPPSVDAFAALSVRNIVGSLLDLTHVTEAQASENGDKGACHLLECPRLRALSDAVTRTISVLEGTKSAFKSRELGSLRRELERLIAN
jgi:CheY-like chemotaxis protein